MKGINLTINDGEIHAIMGPNGSGKSTLSAVLTGNRLYKDGEAVWTYVDIAYSNIGSYAIKGCERKETELHAGDVVITSGTVG